MDAWWAGRGTCTARCRYMTCHSGPLESMREGNNRVGGWERMLVTDAILRVVVRTHRAHTRRALNVISFLPWQGDFGINR